MSTPLDWPAHPAFWPRADDGFVLGPRVAKSAFGAFFSGDVQQVSHLVDRLRVTITLPPCDPAGAALREAFFSELISTGAWVRLGHVLRPEPRGTMRGSPVVENSAAAGVRTIRIRSMRGTTNLLSSALAFEAPPWTGAALVTTNSDTFQGSNTADTLTDNSTGAYLWRAQTFSVPADQQLYTMSVYVRKTTGGTSATFGVNMSLTGGTVINVTGRLNTDTGAVNGTGAAAVSFNADWWRFSLPITNNGTNNSFTASFFPATSAHGSFSDTVAATGSATLALPQVTRGAFVQADDFFPTLLGGDLLGVNSQLLPVAYAGATAFSNGSMDVPLSRPLQRPLTAGQAVVWQQPTGLFQLVSSELDFSHGRGRWQRALVLPFREVFA